MLLSQAGFYVLQDEIRFRVASLSQQTISEKDRDTNHLYFSVIHPYFDPLRGLKTGMDNGEIRNGSRA